MFRELASPRVARLAFWVAWTFSFVMAVIPHPPRIPGDPNDKIQHIMAFLTLALLGSFAFPRAKPWKLLAWLSAFGALIEVIQAIPVLHRDSDILDWLADTLAAGFVILLFAWGRARRAGRG